MSEALNFEPQPQTQPDPNPQVAPELQLQLRRRRKRVAVEKKQYGVRVPDPRYPKGRNIRKRFADARAARAWQENTRREWERRTSGIFADVNPVLINDLVDMYLPTVKPRYYADTKYRLETYIIPRFNRRLINSIHKKEWREFLGDDTTEGLLVAKHGISHGTVNVIKSYLRAMYDLAVEDEKMLCSENPIKGIANRKNPKTQKQILKTKTDAGKYISIALESKKFPYYGIFVALALNTGQRLGQIIALRWQDVDFDNSVITFKYKHNDYVKGFVEGSKKMDGHHHTVGMNAALKEILLKWKKETKFSGDNDYIICDQVTGKWINRKSIYRRNVSFLKKAGLPYSRPHDLRHTFATHYLEANGSIHDLKEILDHSSVTTTERYISMNRTRKKRMMDVLTFRPLSEQEDNVLTFQQPKAAVE